MGHRAWTRTVSKDSVEEFKIYLNRQGWTVTGALTQESDPQVLRIGLPSLLRQPAQLYEFLARRTTRKILRALLLGPQTEESLKGICADRDSGQLSCARR
jgi:hypothetical protein